MNIYGINYIYLYIDVILKICKHVGIFNINNRINRIYKGIRRSSKF